MVNDCDICGDSGIIRLPVRGNMKAAPYHGTAPTALSTREFPCPECGYIPQEKVMIVQAEDIVSEEIKEDDYLSYCKEHIAHKMAKFIFQGGFISFSKGQLEGFRREYSLRGKLGIISPRVVATFEERVKQYQDIKAQKVINKAIKSIRNWESFGKSASEIDFQFIQKTHAIRLLIESCAGGA
jgi:hypothetical protein